MVMWAIWGTGQMVIYRRVEKITTLYAENKADIKYHLVRKHRYQKLQVIQKS